MRKVINLIDEIKQYGFPDEIVLKGDMQKAFEHHNRIQIGSVIYNRDKSGSTLFYREHNNSRKRVLDEEDVIVSGYPYEIVLTGRFAERKHGFFTIAVGQYYYKRDSSGSDVFYRDEPNDNFDGIVGGNRSSESYTKKYEKWVENLDNTQLEDINFDDDIYVSEKIVAMKVSSENIIESMVKAPFRAIRGFGDYLLVDQEKEGREAGIIAATNQYEPILKTIRQRYKKLERYDKQRRANNDSRKEVIKELYYKYVKDNKVLASNIDTIKKSSSKANDFLTNVGYVGISGSASGGIGTSTIGVCSRAGTASTVGLAGLATPMAIASIFVVFGGYLDRRNQEKVNKYFQIEYRRVASEYQSKVDREKNEIKRIIENIKATQKEIDERFNKLEQALNNEVQKFAELNAIYSTIKGL